MLLFSSHVYPLGSWNPRVTRWPWRLSGWGKRENKSALIDTHLECRREALKGGVEGMRITVMSPSFPLVNSVE